MDSTIIILFIGLMAGGIAMVFMSMTKGKPGGTKEKEVQVTDGSVKRKSGKEVQRKNVVDFMEFDRIVDNMIIQENENKFTMVLQCKGINYDLMSEVEQLAVEEGFIVFLNTLKFPVQLYVQARAVDLQKSMNIYNDSVNEIAKKFSIADENYRNLANDIDVDYTKLAAAREERDRYNNILEYAQDITRYVERISLNKNILQRKFYIAFSYYKSEVTSVNDFTKEEIYEICQRELLTRGQTLMSALASCSVSADLLDSNELAELLFISYNRDDEKLLNIRTFLDSGAYRLYSTSKDVYEKKEELLQKEIEEEASRRVQEAIKQTVKNAVVRTNDEIVEDFEESTDRRAVEIIKSADIDDESKETLTNIIAENHVIGVEERKRERELRRMLQQQAMEANAETEEENDVVESTNEPSLNDEKLDIEFSDDFKLDGNVDFDFEIEEDDNNEVQGNVENEDSSEDDLIV